MSTITTENTLGLSLSERLELSFTHGSGNPLGYAVADAVIRFLRDNNMADGAERKGAWLTAATAGELPRPAA